MKASFNTDDVPDDFKAYMESIGISDEKLSSLMENSPRSTFDMFDFYGIHVAIVISQPDSVNSTSYSFLNLPMDAGNTPTNWWDTRIEAEEAAVAAAFELLNVKTLV
jgi:hypothetical protein